MSHQLEAPTAYCVGQTVLGINGLLVPDSPVAVYRTIAIRDRGRPDPVTDDGYPDIRLRAQLLLHNCG